MEVYFENYSLVFIFLILGILLPVGALTFGRLVRPHNPYQRKITTYESGIDPMGDARVRYHVVYYMIAIEFVVFDVETSYLYPWAAALTKFGWTSLIPGLLFILILGLGLAYSWKKKVFEWN